MQRATTRAVAVSPRRVLLGVYDAVVRSKLQCRGKSVAVSVPSGSFVQHRGLKRISKHERRAIVKAFVDKYRASNQGRFPTASHAKQQTGGSFYTVRQIIQELEYNHRMTRPDEHKEHQLGKMEVSYPTSLSESQEISSSSTAVSCSSNKQPLDFGVNLNSKNVDSINIDGDTLVKDDKKIKYVGKKQRPLSSDALANEPMSLLMARTNFTSEENVGSAGNSGTSGQTLRETQIGTVHGNSALPRLVNEKWGDDQDSARFTVSNTSTDSTIVAKEESKPCNSDDVAVDSSVAVKLEGRSFCSPPHEMEGSVEDVMSTKAFQDAHGPKEGMQVSSHEIPKSSDPTGEHQIESEHGGALPKGLSLWDNLKLFTDGVIKFWKKM